MFPGKYHQNGGFSMAMLVYRRVAPFNTSDVFSKFEAPFAVTFLEMYFQQNTTPRNSNVSGQIIATSHDLTPNGGLVREIPLFQGNPGW